MIHSRYFRWAASFLLLTGISVMGQNASSNDVPLKNWATPLYWQPSHAERETTEKSAAQIQFSPNATSTAALVFVAVSPCRLVDTRGASAGFIGSTPFSGPYIPAGGTATFPVQSATETATTVPSPCGAIPSIAQAYSLNLTVFPHPLGTSVNYVTMWPTGAAIPQVSTLNDQQGALVSNAAIVPAGAPSGGINVFAYGATDVIIDMNGFYAAPTDLSNNTAIGAATLTSVTSGTANTAVGKGAMQDTTSGGSNTATGTDALFSNTIGSSNAAVGFSALGSNTSGYYNVAVGAQALQANTTGSNNTANGFQAMYSNTSGIQNTAIGLQTLYNNSVGYNNVAIGSNAGGSILTGSNNIDIGASAGANAPGANSNSIYIGSQGFSYDASVIRLGAEGTQSATFVGGIYGASGGGSAVYVNNVGQLSTTPSSRRFKEQITDMGDTSSKLFQLRPVNFFYKPEYDDGSHLLQYGLIAEEVEKIYPEMVDYEKDGRAHTVKYQFLAPMLLNELKKQNAEIERRKEDSRFQEGRIRKLEEHNQSLEDRIAALEALLSSGATDAKSRGSQ